MTSSTVKAGDDVIGDVTTALTALGAGGILGGVVSGVFGRRKSKAEATEILTRATLSIVEPMRQQLDYVQNALETHKRKDEERETRRRARAAEHKRWDDNVAHQLNQLGHPVPAPPPLEP